MISRHLHLNLSSGFAYENIWPYIDIIINSEIKFSGYIESQLLIDINFDSLIYNHIVIFYKNKRFGPDVWDTIIDNSGNITKDQYVNIKNIRIDECNLNFLIGETPYITVSGQKIISNGYLGLNGYFNIDYSEPYYDWVQDTRLSFFKKQNYNVTDSSLPFITNYVYTPDDEVVNDLLNQLQDTVNAAKKFNYNNPISRTT